MPISRRIPAGPRSGCLTSATWLLLIAHVSTVLGEVHASLKEVRISARPVPERSLMSSRLTPAASRRVACRLVPLVAGASLILVAASVPSVAATADRTVPTNRPAILLVGAQASLTRLNAQQASGKQRAGGPWGVYKGGA